MADKSRTGKILAGLFIGAAAACAGTFAYKKYKEKKEIELERDDDDDMEETTEPETDTEGNVLVRISIPGILTKINVAEGDHVNEGDTVATIGNDLPVEAPAAGTVTKILLKTDTMVSMDDILMTILTDDNVD